MQYYKNYKIHNSMIMQVLEMFINAESSGSQVNTSEILNSRNRTGLDCDCVG